ncbi:MAG: hypothetical protein KDA61_09215 [Planctomycetales bacterium]|nr:hypothetical protein [Planctomycetales bacterium]
MSKHHVPSYLPTPRQIALACEQIRANWTPAEQRRRNIDQSAGEQSSAWLPPEISLMSCVLSSRKNLKELPA